MLLNPYSGSSTVLVYTEYRGALLLVAVPVLAMTIGSVIHRTQQAHRA